MKSLYESILDKDFDVVTPDLPTILGMYSWERYFKTPELLWVLGPKDQSIGLIEAFFRTKKIKEISDPEKTKGEILLCITDGIDAQHRPTRYVGLLRVHNIDGHLLTAEQIVIGDNTKSRKDGRLFMHRNLPVQYETGMTVRDSMLTLDWYDKGNRKFYRFKNPDDGVKYMKQLRDFITSVK